MEGRRPRNSLISGAEGIHKGANRLIRSEKLPVIHKRAERSALNAGRRQGRRPQCLRRRAAARRWARFMPSLDPSEPLGAARRTDLPDSSVVLTVPSSEADE